MASRCASPPLLLVLLLFCVGLPSAFLRPQLGPHGFNLPGGIPLELLLATCGEQDQPGNIGPCLAQLLGGVIDATRANFTSGIRIADDKYLKLDPLKVKDIRRKRNHEFQLGIADILIHGIKGVQIEDINFTYDNVTILMRFDKLRITGKLGLKYLFITVNPEVSFDLDRLKARLTAFWTIQNVDGRINLVLSDARVTFQLGNFVVDVLNLGTFGTFVEQVVNKHSDIVQELIIPQIEKRVTKLVNTKLQTVKLVNHSRGRFSYN